MAIIDLRQYVGLANLRRDLSFQEKYRVTTADGRIRREISGVYINYVLELGNISAEKYDALWRLLTSPDECHTVIMPSQQQGDITFDAIFEGIGDELITEDMDGNRYWDNLTVQLTMAKPLEEGAI